MYKRQEVSLAKTYGILVYLKEFGFIRLTTSLQQLVPHIPSSFDTLSLVFLWKELRSQERLISLCLLQDDKKGEVGSGW